MLSDLDQLSDDILSGSAGRDLLIGDADVMYDASSGGDDVLFGGKGDDRLYGDALNFESSGQTGADRFVFGGTSGKDVIGDFEHHKDVIDVQRLGYTDLSQLTIDVSGGDSVVHFRGSNQVTVLGVTNLDASDFLFA